MGKLSKNESSSGSVTAVLKSKWVSLPRQSSCKTRPLLRRFRCPCSGAETNDPLPCILAFFSLVAFLTISSRCTVRKGTERTAASHRHHSLAPTGPIARSGPRSGHPLVSDIQEPRPTWIPCLGNTGEAKTSPAANDPVFVEVSAGPSN